MATTKYFLVSSGSGKAKPKHQELMDELLQSLYPVLSLCRGHTRPYQVGRYSAIISSHFVRFLFLLHVFSVNNVPVSDLQAIGR